MQINPAFDATPMAPHRFGEAIQAVAAILDDAFTHPIGAPLPIGLRARLRGASREIRP